MVDFILGEEAACAQIGVFKDFYDVDLSGYPDEQKKAMELAEQKVIRAIRTGAIEIEEKEGGLVVRQNLRRPPGEVKTVEYSELTGRAKLAMKSKNDTDHYGKLYALMGSLSGLGETAMAGLKGSDLSIMECMGSLFLLV